MFRKNVASQFIEFQGIDAATGGIKSGVTWTVRRCIDGTFAAATGTVTEDGTTGWYKFAMSQADTNGNNIGLNFTGTGAVPQTVNIVTTAADPTDAVRLGLTALPNAAAEAAGGLYTRGTGAGQINQPANGQVDANAVKLGGTTQTGRDIGASVLLSSGSGTGQLDFTSGVVKANLAQILGTALTETAGQIAAGVKKFFNVASPTGTVNSIPDAVAGAASGLALVGSNVGAATSVTGAVGSVTSGVTVTTNNDKTGYALSTAGVKAIWDQLTSALTTAGSIGKKITDWVLGSDNKSLLSTDAQTGVTIPTVTTLTNAPSDSSGITTLLSRLSATRAGYLDNLSAGAAALQSSLQALITTVGVAGAGLTATASAVWSVATRLLTGGTNIVLVKGTGITGFNDLSTTQVNTEVDTALADYDGPTHTEMTTELATADDAVLAILGTPAGGSVSGDIAAVKSDTVAIKAKTDNLPGAPAATGDVPTANQIADQVWDETSSSHVTGGSTGAILLQASKSKFIKGFQVGDSSNVVYLTGGNIAASYQGETIVVCSSPFIVSYSNQFQGMLFVISDSNSSIEFVASIVSSDAGDNSLTLSRPIPTLGGLLDPIPFMILPTGMGDAMRALILYEGN